MADRPITFSAPMVRALLDGRKVQDRRILKPQPDTESDPSGMGAWGAKNRYGYWIPATGIRPYAPGQRLWVRETWRPQMDADLWACVEYRADGARIKPRIEDEAAGGIFWERCNAVDTDWRQIGIEPQPALWRSPANMPRWASRLTLIVTDVRVERIQDISAADAIAEGCHVYASSATIDCDTPDPRQEYRRLWNSLHGPDAWDANPWVAALTFTVHRQNIDQLNKGATE